MKNIAVVGSGEIGSRHIQGLAKSKNKLNLYVVDTKSESLKLSEKRYYEIPNKLNRIKFLNKISDLPNMLDVVIVSSTSLHRKQIIESLIKISTINNIILEKIVFQNVEDFYTAINLLSKNNIKSWVNCSRRTFKIYKKIKKYIDGRRITMKVTGNDWGMACNSIHHIDLFLFLTNQDSLSFDNSKLKKEIIHSKRENFFEIKGKLSANTKRGDRLDIIDSDKEDDQSFLIEISYKNNGLIIDEFNQRYYKISEDKEELSERIKIPFQSDLTGDLIDQLFSENEIDLPTLGECMKYHIPMLLSFNDHFSNLFNKKIKTCPIT